MGVREVREQCKRDYESKDYLEHAMQEMNFSARARTDLAGKDDITGNEMLEAIQFRSLDRQLLA